MDREQHHELPERLYLLDISRGFASLFVVLCHYHHFYHDEVFLQSWVNQKLYPFAELLEVFFRYGSFSVEYFFVLSGFVFFWIYGKRIQEKKISFQRYAVYRLARLYPLHIATLLVCMILQHLFFRQNGVWFVFDDQDSYHFILNIFLLSGWEFENGYSFNAPSWSISMEMGLYLVFFILAFRNLHGIWKIIAFNFLILLVFKFTGIRSRWMLALPGFLMGGLVFHFLSFYLEKRKWQIDLLIVISTLIFWYFLGTKKYAYEHFYESYILLLFPLTVLSLVLIELNTGKVFRRFALIGDLSYSFYMIHFPLQIVFILVTNHLGIRPSWYILTEAFLIYAAVLFPVSWLSYQFFEEPARGYCRKLAGRFEEKAGESSS